MSNFLSPKSILVTIINEGSPGKSQNGWCSWGWAFIVVVVVTATEFVLDWCTKANAGTNNLEIDANKKTNTARSWITFIDAMLIKKLCVERLLFFRWYSKCRSIGGSFRNNTRIFHLIHAQISGPGWTWNSNCAVLLFLLLLLSSVTVWWNLWFTHQQVIQWQKNIPEFCYVSPVSCIWQKAPKC